MSPPLWTVDAMAAAMRAARAGALPAAVDGISIDSRSIAPGEAYFAIKGDTHDGHAFVASALANGAGVAVVAQDKRHDMPADASLLVVPDVLAALCDLAAAARARSAGKIIAVTGSAGKTSSKEALRLALSRDGETHASVASFNNHWGVPLSLARLPQGARYGVFEIGMNHAGEITPLVQLVRPHIAVITTVAAAHLEFFNSVTEIAEAKAEIFLGLEAGGTAVLNTDHDYVHVLFAEAREARVETIVTYGYDAEAEYRIGASETAGSRTFARVTHGKETYDLNLGVRGRHMIANAASTTTLTPSIQSSCGSSTATIWPVSRPNLFADRPGYNARNSTPSPRPNGISTPMIDERSRARTPSTPITRAAIRDPRIDPITTLKPTSSANDAPAKDSSLIPCTAKVRSRIITKTPIRPPINPSNAPAMIEFCSSASSSP